MKSRFNIQLSYGIVFLLLGLLWLGSIYIRSQGYRFYPKGTPAVSYQKIQTQLAQRIEVRGAQLKIKPFSLRRHLPEVFIIQFWMIAAGEFLCAILFLVAGFALLRAYPLCRPIAAGVLMGDLLLKFLVWSYQNYILLPLKEVFEGKNILLMYFAPEAGLPAKIAAFLTGIPLVRPGAALYGCCYAVVWSVSLWIFINPKGKNPS